MIRSRRTLAVLAFAPFLAACGAGLDANTSKSYHPVEAAGEKFNGITIANAFALGPDSGKTLPTGGTVPLYLTLVNGNGTPDQLAGVAASLGGAQLKATGSPVPLKPGDLVSLTSGATQIQLQGLPKELRGGESVTVTFNFARAGSVTLQVPVITRSREFANLPEPPTTTPSAP